MKSTNVPTSPNEWIETKASFINLEQNWQNVLCFTFDIKLLENKDQYT